MGIQALKSHINGKKHKERCKPVSIFFKKPDIKVNIENSDIVKASSSKVDTFSNQLTLDQSLATSNKWKDEIRWDLKSVISWYSE